MKKLRVKRVKKLKPKITVKSILQNFSTDLTVGNRKFKTATPFAVKRFLQAKDRRDRHVDATINWLQKEFSIWRKKKISKYSKRWQTRIKNRIKFLLEETWKIYEKNKDGWDDFDTPPFDMYDYMNGIPLEEIWGTSQEAKWHAAVEQYFNGDNNAAVQAYYLWKQFHEKK